MPFIWRGDEVKNFLNGHHTWKIDQTILMITATHTHTHTHTYLLADFSSFASSENLYMKCMDQYFFSRGFFQKAEKSFNVCN